jgi:hypothetical protein
VKLVWRLHSRWQCDKKEKRLGPEVNLLYPSPPGKLERKASTMTKILDEVLAANAKYAENFGDKGNLPLPPSRHFAILTCMDAPV